jgi:hypothetical protein
MPLLLVGGIVAALYFARDVLVPIALGGLSAASKSDLSKKDIW